jgi:HMW1C N-terminal/HMW1 domain 2
MDFILEQFEHAVYSRQYEESGRLVLGVLQQFDANYGNVGAQFLNRNKTDLNNGQNLDIGVMTRLAAAITCLFSDPGFQLSAAGYLQLLPMQRWLASIFAVTPFRHADHIIRGMNAEKWDSPNLSYAPQNLPKLALLSFPDSEIPMDLDMLWKVSPPLAASLAMIWLSPRFLGTKAAHDKREYVLGWLPDKLPELDFDTLPMGIIQDVVMHSSYAARPDRHNIKKGVNAVIRKKLEAQGWEDILAPVPSQAFKAKPVMLVVLEWFNAAHSIYRTHSTTLRAAREQFWLVGMGYEGQVDAAGRAVFDEFIPVKQGALFEQLTQIKEEAISRSIDALYMPSVGMFPLTILMSNTRIAPVQFTALGHSATTNSPNIDYFVADDDYVGDEACFSETMIRLPIDVMTFVPSAASPKNLIPNLRRQPDIVKIAVGATSMKLNPAFLNACVAIAERAQTKVEFHFMIGQATALVYPQIVNFIQSYLGSKAIIYSGKPYPEYMRNLNECDMFINPFPYGNMNGIVDVVTLGMVGVCLTGREVFEHIDQGLFERLQLPGWMIATTVADYVAAAIRLVDDHAERLQLRRDIISRNGLNTLFSGRPEIFGQEILKRVEMADNKANMRKTPL